MDTINMEFKVSEESVSLKEAVVMVIINYKTMHSILIKQMTY